MVVVHTNEELSAAKERKADEIIIVGELAEKVKNGKTLRTLGPIALGILGAALAATPFTGGASAVAGVSAITATTGVGIGAIIAATAVGLGLLLAIWRDYDEISFEAGPKPKLTLKRISSGKSR